MISGNSLAGFALLSIAMVACAKAPPPPLLSLSDRPCATTPDLSAALPVTVNADSAAKTTFDEQTPCLQPSGAAMRLYAAFALPQSETPYFLTINSEIRGQGVLAPHVVMLNVAGETLREIPHGSFLMRGSALSVSFRPQPNETFILVSSDPNAVGQQSEDIVGMTQTTTVSTGTGFFMMNTGHESVRRVSRAHGGVVTVSAQALPQQR